MFHKLKELFMIEFCHCAAFLRNYFFSAVQAGLREILAQSGKSEIKGCVYVKKNVF